MKWRVPAPDGVASRNHRTGSGQGCFPRPDVSVTGDKVFNKKIKHAKQGDFFEGLSPFVIGMEASVSAHHLNREPRKLWHDARLMPATYVKPYVTFESSDG